MKRRGAVLVAVLVLVTMAGMVAAGLLFRMHATVAASTAVANGEQAYAAALSGIERAMAILETAADDETIWRDNAELFRNQFVCDDGASEWYFTIYARGIDEPDQQRYGLTDEGGRINLNEAPAEVLAALPGMTDELVDCLLDYLDPDEETRPNGAEQDYYDRLAFPYRIPNAKELATLEELLLVKGFNGRIVYGEDANLNGLLDPNEDNGDEQFPADDRDGVLNTGLRGIATAMTYGLDVDSEEQRRVNVNTASGEQLRRAGLSDDTVVFIQLYRQDAKGFDDPSELLNMSHTLTAQQEIGEKVYAAGTIHESGVGAEELPIVCDKLTTSESPILQGRLNVNSAPAEALAAIPGIDDYQARSIVDQRPQMEAEDKKTIAWLYTEGVLNEDDFKRAALMLTARSYQYRVQCIGFGVPCGRVRVLEAVIDTARGRPRITYLRDITRLGVPVSLDVESQEIAL